MGDHGNMMESVVLTEGDPVFEDVHVSHADAFAIGDDAPAEYTKPATTPKAAAISSPPVESPTPSSPAVSHTVQTPASPSSYPSTYPEAGGAFVPPPEYRRESSFVPEFRETTINEPQTVAQREVFPIEIQVADPEKFGEGMNAYITYKIKTHTTLPKYKGDAVVVRRYNDFLWFHEQLRIYNRGFLIPPLPEKALINRFSSDFIEIRRKELEKFLNRVGQHPHLNKRPETVFFLEANDEQLHNMKTRGTTKPAAKAQEAAPAPQSSGFGSLFNAINQGLNQGITAVSNLTNTATAREIDQWFDAKKNHINTLESQLGTLLKYTSRLLTKRKELASANSDFSSAMSIVGSFEADTDAYSSNAFIRIAQITDHIKDLTEQLWRNETTHFEEALKDYLRLLGAVKDILDDRDQVLLEYQNAARSLESKKEKMEKEKARGAGAKVRGFEKDVEDAAKRVDDSKRDYETISTRVRGELVVFDNTRAKEIRRMIALLVQASMENSLQVVDLWKSYISENQGNDVQDYKTADKVGWGGVGALR